MNFRKDHIFLPKDFAFDLFEANGILSHVKHELHFHDCLELNYIVEDGGVNYIENNRFPLKANDFYVINNLEHHMAFSDGKLRMKVIVFDPKLIWNNSPFDYEYLKPFYERSVFFSNRISSDNPLAPEIMYLFGKIENEWSNRLEGYKMVIKGILTELLAILYRHFKNSNSLGKDVVSFHRAYDRLRIVIDFINTRPGSDFTLEQLSSMAHMNKTYFSSYFKRTMGVTVFKYIENIRIDYACILLRTTKCSITDVAINCGYKNISHFSRAFRASKNISPKGFRTQK